MGPIKDSRSKSRTESEIENLFSIQDSIPGSGFKYKNEPSSPISIWIEFQIHDPRLELNPENWI